MSYERTPHRRASVPRPVAEDLATTLQREHRRLVWGSVGVGVLCLLVFAFQSFLAEFALPTWSLSSSMEWALQILLVLLLVAGMAPEEGARSARDDGDFRRYLRLKRLQLGVGAGCLFLAALLFLGGELGLATGFLFAVPAMVAITWPARNDIAGVLADAVLASSEDASETSS